MAPRADSPMIVLALILVAASWPQYGQAGLVKFYDSVPEHAQPEKRVPVNDYAMHGPIVDDHEFPGDLREPYPGKSFGPMGPVDGSLPDDVSFRSLSADTGDNHPVESHLASHPANGDPSNQRVPEYKIMSVEFHRVETPFVIGIWIFFASIAKIGTRATRLASAGAWLLPIPLVIAAVNSDAAASNGELLSAEQLTRGDGKSFRDEGSQCTTPTVSVQLPVIRLSNFILRRLI